MSSIGSAGRFGTEPLDSSRLMWSKLGAATTRYPVLYDVFFRTIKNEWKRKLSNTMPKVPPWASASDNHLLLLLLLLLLQQ